MNHDALCAKYGLDTDPGQGVWGYEPPVRPCDCARFAEVRGDERMKATWTYTIHPHEEMVAKIVRWQDNFGFVVFDGEGQEFASGAAGDPIAVSDMMQDYLAAEWGNRRLECPWRVTDTGVNWTSCTLGFGHEGPHLFDGPESGTRGCAAVHVVFDESRPES